MTRSLPLAVAGLLGLASLAFAGEETPPPAAPAPGTGAPAPAAAAAASEDALKELGRRLFFDPAASRVGMRACSDCHSPAHGYSDPETRSRDDVGPTRRHAQTIVDTGNLKAGHWDGEFERIEDVVRSRLNVEISPSGQVRYPTQTAREESDERKAKDPGLLAADATPAVPDVSSAGDRASAGDGAPAGDGASAGDGAPAGEAAATPSLPPAASAPDLAESVGRFVDSAVADGLIPAHTRVESSERYGSAFEAVFGSRTVTLDRLASALQRYCRGVVSGESAYDRFAAGDASALSESAKRGLALFRGGAGCATCHTTAGPRATFTDGEFHNTGVSWRATPGPSADLGAGRHTHRNRHFRAFKTPTLRDVARRAPYMHDGRLASLADVVRHYAAGPGNDPRIDPAFPKFAPTGTDVADLVSFLESLTSDRRPGLAPSLWSLRAERTVLTFVDEDDAPIANLAVALSPAGDVLPGFAASQAAAQALVTGADGSIAFAPPRATHVRIGLEGGLVPDGGDLVPDTCSGARIRLPVRGRAGLRVRLPEGARPPASLVAVRPDAKTFPGRRAQVSVFTLKESKPVETGGVEATYDAFFRTDVGPAADLRIPGASRLRVLLDRETPPTVTLP